LHFQKRFHVKIPVEDESQEKQLLADDAVMQAITLARDETNVSNRKISTNRSKKSAKKLSKADSSRKRSKTDYIASEPQPGP